MNRLTGLTPEGISELRKLLLDLNRLKGITILISSHILNELEQIVTCFGILHNGRIKKEMSMKEVLKSNMTLEQTYMLYTKGEHFNV